MDWLTFFSTNIKSLAWPAVAIIALFVLKRQLGDLLQTLGKRLQPPRIAQRQYEQMDGLQLFADLEPELAVVQLCTARYLGAFPKDLL